LRSDDRADAGFVEQLRHELADVRQDLVLELGGLGSRASIRRASERSARTIASSSGVREAERRKRLQRRINCPTGSCRSSSRTLSGAVTITLRPRARAAAPT
jgi:hypothetical protein